MDQSEMEIGLPASAMLLLKLVRLRTKGVPPGFSSMFGHQWTMKINEHQGEMNEKPLKSH